MCCFASLYRSAVTEPDTDIFLAAVITTAEEGGFRFGDRYLWLIEIKFVYKPGCLVPRSLSLASATKGATQELKIPLFIKFSF